MRRASPLVSGILLALLAMPVLADGAAPAPPEEVFKQFPELALSGSDDYNVLFWDVYIAALWAQEGEYAPDAVHVLVLKYERDFEGKAIADRSLDEIKDIGAGSAEQQASWHASMLALFPDVTEGDQLTGVHLPGEQSHFYWNGDFIGAVDDPAFGRAFFGIWLDPDTNAPGLRSKLIAGRTEDTASISP
ncbi:MAG: chalcone isomerase family protein [Gammaproteobacteria bacterium]|nr:chalcone isomerase family protein [Gammaproteobacteria bacterium]